VTTNDVNIGGTLNMLTAARAAGVVRFVYAGSSATYGDDEATLKVETQMGRPLSPYALSKNVNELYAELFARCYGCESVGLRYFNVFGPRQDANGPYAAVIPRWIASMIGNEPVFINGDGSTVRDFCHVANVVQANLLAATVRDAAAVNQVYNIGLGERTTLDELFEMIRALLTSRYAHVRPLRPLYREFRPGDVRFSQADISKATSLLRYRPVKSVHAGLAETVDWYVASVSGLHWHTECREALQL